MLDSNIAFTFNSSVASLCVMCRLGYPHMRAHACGSQSSMTGIFYFSPLKFLTESGAHLMSSNSEDPPCLCSLPPNTVITCVCQHSHFF